MFVYTLDDVITLIILIICALSVSFLLLMLGVGKIINILFNKKKEK